MVSRAISWIALACCGLVLCSFGLFARDQVAGASAHQQSELATGPTTTTSATPPQALAPPHAPAQPRRFIDDAARTLTSPFDSLVRSHSQWVERGLPTIVALIVYGLGLGYLARFSRGRAH